MVKSTKKAFTLVELIVVITILAILGTIAFISLSGYSAEARDSRRVTNISNLTDKINIELVKGKTVPSTLVNTGATTVNTSAIGSGTTVGLRGAANFATIKENGANFKDPKATATDQDYPLAIAIGGTGSGAYQFLQMAASLEADNMARVRGNYFVYGSLTEASLIKNKDGTLVVTDGGANLPYAIN